MGIGVLASVIMVDVGVISMELLCESGEVGDGRAGGVWELSVVDGVATLVCCVGLWS